MIVPIDVTDAPAVSAWCRTWNTVRGERGRTPDELRFEIALDVKTRLWLVVDVAGRTVGAARLVDSRWTAPGEPVELRCATFPSHTSAVAGLLEVAVASAHGWGADRLSVECRDLRADDELRRLLQSSGFRAHDEDVESTLDIADATLWPSTLPAGMELSTLALRPHMGPSAHRCFELADADEPTDVQIPTRPYRDWAREFDGPWTSPDDCLIAVMGDTVVGWASLERFAAAPEVGWNGFTGTHPDHRRQGVAGHLKCALVEHARRLGLRQLRTENHVANASMRRINDRLGYVPSHVNTWWRLAL